MQPDTMSSINEKFEALRCQIEALQERCDTAVQSHLAFVQINASRHAIV